MADNATLARSLYEAWNNRDFDYGARMTADDATLVDVGSGTTMRGPEGARQYSEAWAGAFPDGRITIDRLIDAGDVVVVEYTGRGTHTGPLVSEAGTIPATGRSVTLQFCDITEFAAGKVRSQRTYFDTGSMMAQLGLAGAPQASTTK